VLHRPAFVGANPDDPPQRNGRRFTGAVRAFATPEMVLVVVVSFVFGLMQTMYRPLIAPYAITLGADTFVAGVAVAAQSFPGLVFAVPGGSVVDRLGARNVLLLSGLALVSGGALLGGLGTLAALFAAMVITGVGTLGVALSVQSLATNPVGDSGPDTRRVAGFGAAVLCGQLVGPTLGGVLSDTGGYQAAFWAICVVGSLLIAFTLFAAGRIRTAARDRGADPAPPPAQDGNSYGRAARLLRSRGIRAAVGLSFLGVMLQNLRIAFLPLYLDGIGWSASAIGVLLSGAAAAALLTRLGFPAVERVVPLHVLLRVCLVAGAVSVAVVVATGNLAVIVVATAMSGILLGAVAPSTLTMLARTVADGQRGVAIGLRVSANRAAQSAGPLLFGALSALAGLRLAFFVVTGLTAVASSVASSARAARPDRS
jgi:MFS family permease